MAKKVYSSDLAKANTDNMGALTAVIDSSQAVVSVLNSFIDESSSILKGGGYDAIRVKLSLYANIYKALNQICINYESIAKNANNSMLNYMEGYSVLDDSKIEEYRVRLKQIAGYIKYLQDESAKVENTVDYTSLINYWIGIYKELYHYKELLEGLAGKDNSLYGGFDGVTSDIENISRAIIGIHDSTFTPTQMEAFKLGKTSLYNYDPNLRIFGYKFDTSNMSEKAIETLKMLEEYWPDDMEEQRYKAIETALSLLDKGIYYSQPGRYKKDKNGNPISMDCSSFVTYCLMAAGQKIKGTDDDWKAYTGYYVNSKYYDNIKRADLRPGDVALLNTSTSGGVSNHIGMYIGRDSKGRETWIEMSGNGIFISHGKKGWTVFKRYNAYN